MSKRVRIIADNLSAALVEALGNGRQELYTGIVVDGRHDRVCVRLDGDGRLMWFDADALTTNFTIPMELQ